MNCKPGDLAIIAHTRSHPEFLGHIVRIIKPYPCSEPAWVIDPPIRDVLPGWDGSALYDSALRPIRDNDGEDEMLRIAGLPREKETT